MWKNHVAGWHIYHPAAPTGPRRELALASQETCLFFSNEGTDDPFHKLASGQEGKGGQTIWQDCGDSVPSWDQKLVTSSAQDCVSEAAMKQLRTDLRQGSKYGRARILSFGYQQRLSEVSASSECRPHRILTLDWNSSLLGAPNLPLLTTWFMMLGSVHWGSRGWGDRSFSLLSNCAPSTSQTLHRWQIRRSTGCKGFSRRGLNQSKDPNQKKALEVYVSLSFSYLYAKIPLCFSYLIRVGYFFSILTLKN